MNWMGFDVETSGSPHDYALQPWRVAQGTAWVTSTVSLDPARRVKIDMRMDVGDVRVAMERMLRHAIKHDLRIVGWNVMFDIQWLIAYGLLDLVQQVKWLDGMLLWKHAVLEPDGGVSVTKRFKFGLKECVSLVLPEHAGYEDGVDYHATDAASLTVLHDYNVRDVKFTLVCARHWWERLNDRQRATALIEADCLPTLALANYEGLTIDTLKARDVEVAERAKAQRELAKLTILGANSTVIASPAKLASLLFDQWKVPSAKITATGSRSTDKEVLTTLALDDPRVASILTYRNTTNSVKKFIEAPLAAARYNGDGKARPQAKLFGTYCVTADTVFATDRGVKTYASVSGEDRVLTHEGRWMRVVAKLPNGVKPVLRVSLDNGMSLDCTPDHPLLAEDGRWVLAADILGETVRVHGSAERWSRVNGWPYSISSWGRVVSDEGVQLKQYSGDFGRLTVQLKRHGAQTRGEDRRDFRVHRLVLAAFVGPPSSNDVVCRHLNGCAWDNRLENLAWGLADENAADVVRHGTARRSAAHRRKLTDDQVSAIRHDARTRQVIADEYGVCRELVGMIKRGVKRGRPLIPATPIQFLSACVTSVTSLGDLPTFGIEVEHDHSHITNGIVTHNTGRLSYASSQMGAVPGAKPGTWKKGKLPIGFALHQMQRGPLYRQSVVAPPGFVLVEFDAAGQEFRWMALLSGDATMLRLCRPGEDAHSFMGANIAGVSYAALMADVHSLDKAIAAIAKPRRQLGKVGNLSCIKEGTPVLTDRGEVAIEDVRSDDLLWDGVEWVAHGGVVYMGEKHVIEYQGLVATPDHLVLVDDRWVEFGEAARYGWRIRGAESGVRKAQELARDRGEAPVYDILNAGPRNRFTAAGLIVHNCQYRTSAPTLRKVANVQYGMTMSEAEAEHIIRTYKATYPGVPRYWTNQINFGRTNAYVENLAGRRLRLRGNWMGRGTGWALESATINWPIQSIGAEQKFLALRDTAPIVRGYGARLALDLHDGLYFYAPIATVDKFMVEMKDTLDHLDYVGAWGYTPTIPLPFDAKFGPSWGSLKEVTF